MEREILGAEGSLDMAALKLVVDSLEGMDTVIQSFYKQGSDNKFYLDKEEDIEVKKKVDEFRENNINLMKERDDLLLKMKDIDPVKYAEMQKQLEALGDKKLIDAGKIDEVVAQRTERLRADANAQQEKLTLANKKLTEELAKTNFRLSEVLIDAEITKAVTAIGMPRKGAMQDILARAKLTWKLEDGKPVPMESDHILYGKDGKSPMSFEEYAQAVAETAPFLFEPTGGGGGHGGAGDGGENRDTDKKLIDLPPDERLRKIHEETALKLAREARK